MKAVWSDKPASVEIKSAYKPQKGYDLSGVVRVKELGLSGFCYIKFDETLVAILGMKMPYGIGPCDPAYLRAVLAEDGSWRIHCCYIEEGISCLLWVQPEMPEWIRRISYDT